MKYLEKRSMNELVNRIGSGLGVRNCYYFRGYVLLVRQRVSVQPAAQVHEYLFIWSTHTAPLAQGLLRHSSTSSQKITTRKIMMKFFFMQVAGHTRPEGHSRCGLQLLYSRGRCHQLLLHAIGMQAWVSSVSSL